MSKVNVEIITFPMHLKERIYHLHDPEITLAKFKVTEDFFPNFQSTVELNI